MSQFEEKYKGVSIAKLAKAMVKLRDKHDKQKEAAALTWSEVDYLRFIAIPKALDSAGLESVKVPGVGRVGLRPDASCKTIDPIALVDWLKDHDHGDLAKPTVNSSSLKALIKELIREGEEIPGDDIIEFKPFEFAVITK